MPALIPYSKVCRVNTGDILVTSTFVPTVKHFAIIFHRDGVPMVADNQFWSQKLTVDTLDEYDKNRNIIGIIRNEDTLKLKDEDIEDKILKAKKINYKFFNYNCEDFVRDVCNCNIGFDQRITYLVIVPIGILLSLLLYRMFKTPA